MQEDKIYKQSHHLKKEKKGKKTQCLYSNEVNVTTVALYMVVSVRWHHSNRLCRPLKPTTNEGKLL